MRGVATSWLKIRGSQLNIIAIIVSAQSAQCKSKITANGVKLHNFAKFLQAERRKYAKITAKEPRLHNNRAKS